MGLWTVGGSGVDVHDNAYNNLGDGGAEGQSHINLGGDSGGSISQVISALIPGNSYRLDFNYALHNLAGGQATASLSIAGLNASFTATIDGSVVWTSASYNFSATSSSETLIFTGISSNGDAGAGVLLDAVSVSEASTSGVVTALPETPRNSSTLLVESSSGSDRIWNVNPDNDSVSVSSAAGTLLAEIAVGDKPWSLARDPGSNRVFVTNKLAGSTSIIDTTSLSVVETVPLPFSSQPHGIAFNSTGSEYYVVLEAIAVVEKRNAVTHEVTGSTQLTGVPRHIAVAFDDSRLLVSNFVTPMAPGESTQSVDLQNAVAEVFAIDPATMTLTDTITLAHDNRSPGESSGPGLPNYLNAPVITFDGLSAYVPSKKDNIGGGTGRSSFGLIFDSAVRAQGSRITLSSASEDTGFRFDFDNSSVATGAALTGDSRYLLTALETSRELSVFDTENGFELMRLPTGRAPQGVALSSDGSIAYVHNFMDRSISRFDLTNMIVTELPSMNELPSIAVVTTEVLSTPVLQGKQFFYDAADDRLARDNYMSCASCHNDAGDDGRVWDFTQFGEGLRNTVTLRGRGGIGHGLLHWSGNFDEVQDFEGQIRAFAGGTGLMDTADFLSGTRSEPMGDSKTGFSQDLDALAAYLGSLTLTDANPQLAPGGPSASAVRGEAVFAAQNCVACHSDPLGTDSYTSSRHDVGTITTASGQRLGQTLDGFDTPTLFGLGTSAPYLHDGSAATVEAAISAHSGVSLSGGDLTDLANYLLELPQSLSTQIHVDGPRLHGGTLQVGSTWQTVLLPQGYTNPVVIASVEMNNTQLPAVTRIRNLGTMSFDIRIQNPSDASLSGYDVHYLVAEAGSYTLAEDGITMEVRKVTSTLTDENNSWAGQSIGYLQSYSNPVVLGQLLTENDAGWSVFWASDGTQGNPPSAASLYVGKHVAEDTNVVRADELLGIIVVEAGSGSAGGIDYQAGVTADNIMGLVDSGAPYGTSLSISATNAVLSSTGMDGGNGGWPALDDRLALPGTQLGIGIDEDQIADAERNRTTDQIAFFAFVSAIAPVNTAPTVTNPGSQSNGEGDSVSLAISASDADGDTLSYGATGLPVGLAIDPGTGTISGTISTPGNYNVTVSIDDGNGGTESAIFSWVVAAAPNTAPSVVNPGSQSSIIGDSISVAISASDADGDTLSYGATGLPGGLAIDAGTGTISGTANIAGNFNVTVTVDDGNGGTDSESFSWQVTTSGFDDLLIEAEDAQLSEAQVATNHAGASGGVFVDITGNSSNTYISWDVNVPSAGTYVVALRYALAGGTRPMTLQVNGSNVATVPFTATGSWSSWGSVVQAVTLSQGNNQIRVIAAGSSGPNIDLLTVSQN